MSTERDGTTPERIESFPYQHHQQCICLILTGGYHEWNPRCELHGERVSQFRLKNGAIVQVMNHAPFCLATYNDGDRRGKTESCDCLRDCR
jgi:hypothetical protein